AHGDRPPVVELLPLVGGEAHQSSSSSTRPSGTGDALGQTAASGHQAHQEPGTSFGGLPARSSAQRTMPSDSRRAAEASTPRVTAVAAGAVRGYHRATCDGAAPSRSATSSA